MNADINEILNIENFGEILAENVFTALRKSIE